MPMKRRPFPRRAAARVRRQWSSSKSRPMNDFGADGEVATPATGDEDEDIIPEADRGEEPEDDDEEEEEY